MEEAHARTSTGASTEAVAGTKKKGRKEIKLNALPEELVHKFTGFLEALMRKGGLDGERGLRCFDRS